MGSMSPESIHSFLTVAFGFAVAGMLANFYQLVTTKPASFTLLSSEERAAIFAALPFLIFTAPFIIMRNIIRAQQFNDGGFGYAMLATVIAGLWSLMSGTVLVRAIEALGILAV